jgi:hypothetical protein
VTAWRISQDARAKGKWLQLQCEKIQLTISHGKAVFALWKWYGRTGNNIQQLIVVIAHAEAFGGSFQLEEDFISIGPLRGIVNAFKLDFAANPDRAPKHLLSRAFFHYTEYSFSPSDYRRIAFLEGHSPRRDCLLGRHYIESHAHRIAQTHLLPNIKESSCGTFSRDRLENTLVIHLRAGDVSELNSHYYISNPLYYYAQLSQFYPKAIIVTEPGSTHVLMDSVRSLFPDHELVHGSADDDFQLLRHSVNLASSGVGTFAIAAVLLSQHIKQFHCTDVFQIEHLNPLMIDAAKVNVRMLQLHGYADQWLRSQNRRDLLLNWRPRPQASPTNPPRP